MTAAIARDRSAVDLHGYEPEEHDRICRAEFEFLSDLRRLAAEWGDELDAMTERQWEPWRCEQQERMR